MTDQKANIVLSATDRVSGVLAGIAARMEKTSAATEKLGRIAGWDNVRAGLQLMGEQSQGLAKAWGKLQGAASGLVTTLKWVGGGAAAVAGAGYGLVSFWKSANDAARQIDDLAGRYQVNSQTLQLAGVMVAESGGSFEDAAKSSRS